MNIFQTFSYDLLHDRHRIGYQQLYQHINTVTDENSLAEKVLAMKTVKELFAISLEFDKNNLNFIPLKGPVLSFRLYGDSSFRLCRDLDILIDEQNIGYFIGILLNLGYSYDQYNWPANLLLQQSIIKHTNQVSLTHPQKKITIELHWRLFNIVNITSSGLNDMIKNNLSKISFGGRDFSVLSNEMELLYLIIHGGLHYWRRLKWLLDVDVFINTQSIDWNQFSMLMNTLNANRLVVICREIHSFHFPESPKIPISGDKVNYLYQFSLTRIKLARDLEHNSISGILKSLKFQMMAFPGVSYRMKVIRNYFFIPELINEHGIFNKVPFIYLQGFYKLVINRFKR